MPGLYLQTPWWPRWRDLEKYLDFEKYLTRVRFILAKYNNLAVAVFKVFEH